HRLADRRPYRAPPAPPVGTPGRRGAVRRRPAPKPGQIRGGLGGAPAGPAPSDRGLLRPTPACAQRRRRLLRERKERRRTVLLLGRDDAGEGLPGGALLRVLLRAPGRLARPRAALRLRHALRWR